MESPDTERACVSLLYYLLYILYSTPHGSTRLYILCCWKYECCLSDSLSVSLSDRQFGKDEPSTYVLYRQSTALCLILQAPFYLLAACRMNK